MMSIARQVLRDIWGYRGSRRRVRRPFGLPESLEPRQLLVDLSGAIGNVQPSSLQRGQQISVDWSVANSGFDIIFTSFDVSFWLSRDGSFSFDDQFLGNQTMPAGFPGFFGLPTQTRFLALPAASDAYWGTDQNFQLLLLVDGFNQVFESSEFNNLASISLTIRSDGGGGGGGIVGELDQLPATGVAPGAVLGGVLRDLPLFLKDAAKAQKELRVAVDGAIPTAEKQLTALAASIRSLGKAFRPLVTGSADSVSLGPGENFTRQNLDVLERYLKFILSDDSTITAANRQMASAAAAKKDDSLLNLIPGYGLYQDAKKWVEGVGKKIDAAWEATKKWASDTVDSAKRKLGQLAATLGLTAKKAGDAQLEGKAVTEGGQEAKPRVAEQKQLNPAEKLNQQLADFEAFQDKWDRVNDASAEVADLMRQIRDSLAQISDEILDGTVREQNSPLLGSWAGTVQRDGLTGDIRIQFRESANKLSGSTQNTFFENGRRVSSSQGKFEGVLGADGVFRGIINVRNKTGQSGDVPLVWTLNNGQLTGNLFEDPELARRLPFVATKTR